MFSLRQRGEVTLKLFCRPAEKGYTLKGKNLLPMETNSFPIQKALFQKDRCI